MGGTIVADADLLANVRAIAADMASERMERQRRRHLERSDFERLADAGYLLTGIPADQGGLWRGVRASVRQYSELIYTIARGDPSVALVASMHPVVLVYWLANDAAPDPYAKAWTEQRDQCFQTARDRHWWGTITSEPGSGGDIMKTRTVAEPDGAGGYRLTGDKHFGSGSGVTSYMITTAKPTGGTAPTMFFMDVRDADWTGAQGMKLTADWDGHGMSATQSHGFRFDNYPAQAIAWLGAAQSGGGAAAQLSACMFTSVIVAVVEEAIATARARLGPKKAEMRAYEQVEWTRVVNQAWTIRQVYEGMLTAVEQDKVGVTAASRGKAVIAELAESSLTLLSRVVGGGSFSRAAPFGQWAQDVRALGFLRPPWGLAYDQLHAMSWAD
ncbi:MAG TPA: acyl-CoA dehydrogenase family protein [Phenylobacterium sp.]|nr:acyl-CoA dehydrogenase family protein [Phenylobacterium sp.]